MKFYIQSQNPELFSEIYHDVSYPDQPIKPLHEQPVVSLPNASTSASVTELDAVNSTITLVGQEPDDCTEKSDEIKDLNPEGEVTKTDN